jgi:excisionase family DNA binding protein
MRDAIHARINDALFCPFKIILEISRNPLQSCFVVFIIEMVSCFVRQKEAMSEIKNRLLTKSDVAEMLNISLRQVDLLRDAGAFPIYKVGGQIRFKLVDIESYLEQRKEVVIADETKSEACDAAA